MPTTADRRLGSSLRAHLARIYPPDDAAVALAGLLEVVRTAAGPPQPPRPLTERDVWLITYADQVRDGRRPPLQVLADLLDRRLDDVVTGVHLLPCYPWSSDDGFAVVDPERIDPRAGSWADVTALAGRRRLMLDAVVNHLSPSSPWFAAWLEARPDAPVAFLEPGDGWDLSRVTRPRTTPLLTPIAGRRVWTTFSADQVDLDYRDPRVLVTMTRLLLGYVARGAGALRLDAVGFLWKASGTTCLHLPQTHEVVRLWRTVLDHVAPGTLLVTETNVPHAENVAYFGRGDDEAHLVYQFPLAPLLLAAFERRDASRLAAWAATLATPGPQAAFLNFLGCHDGVGVRPVEGLLDDAELDALCALAVRAGGGVSHRSGPDGTLVPYELNTTSFSALEAVADDAEDNAVARHLAAHAVLLALAGVPALYVQGLVGGRNWVAGARATGRLRTVNRRPFDLAELERELDDPSSVAARVAAGISRLVRLRATDPAFHPTAEQTILPGPAWRLAIVRGRRPTRALVVVNVTDRRRTARLPVGGRAWQDRLGGGEQHPGEDGLLHVPVAPWGIGWWAEVLG